MKVLSLATWAPGVFIFSRTAKKLTTPKRVKSNKGGVGLEASLTMIGQGRHYIDAYVRRGVTLGEKATGYDASGQDAEARPATVAQVSDGVYGFEVEASAECYYEILVDRGEGVETLRINFSCDETTAEGCKTEFERLIRLNRQEGSGRATTEVQLERQARCADLQTWILDKARIDLSYRPLVMAQDYGEEWGPPTWADAQGALLSRGRFLLDPRPAFADFNPPEEYLSARKGIAEFVRGADENGLCEGARFGETLLKDPEFATLVDKYVGAFTAWLESDPDVAAWADVVAVHGLEPDGKTLVQQPDAVLLTPLHPLRVGWHALAQRSLYQAYQQHLPCPAASILIRTACRMSSFSLYGPLEAIWSGGRSLP
ncbi:MAG: hypothetical protein IPG75_15285 [Gemmatimonadetes bacterium]|nr:hypothetical protein [Gemmatimonadota bacterium]